MRTGATWALRAALYLAWVGAAQGADMIALRYIDRDPGDPPYLTRIFVTPEFMRMDSGEDDGDFLLLDRRQRLATNVLRDNNAAMVFKPGVVPGKPANWNPSLNIQPAPPGTRRFTLTVADVVCSEGVAAPAAAPDAARAMAELKRLLAAMQYRVWQSSPSDLQHDCDLANQVWESDATLKLGLPLEERDFTGRTRQLESESKQPLRPGLFRVPEGLTEINGPS